MAHRISDYEYALSLHFSTIRAWQYLCGEYHGAAARGDNRKAADLYDAMLILDCGIRVNPLDMYGMIVYAD